MNNCEHPAITNGICEECRVNVRKLREREHARRVYAAYDASRGRDLDSWGNSFRDYD